MSIWSVDQQLNTPDELLQRTNFGTLAGTHIISGSVSGKKVLSIIDDSDARINYGVVTTDPNAPGATTASFTAFATSDFQFGGTYTIIGGNVGTGAQGSAALLRFNGTSIAVLGGINPSSGTMRVYIDGVETKGRIPVYTGLRLGGQVTGQGIVGLSDTTIPALAGSLSFSAAGIIYINAELISYTSRDSNGFYGCVRGVSGTTPSIHNSNETIYQWDSYIGLYSTGYASKQVLYYNPLLSQGDHTIIIVAETNASSGNAEIYFDGFSLGTLLGAGSIFTQIATVTISCTTSANGHMDIGALVSSNNDVARLAFLGATQSNTEVDNAVPLSNVGIKYIGNQPFLYIHNGPVSASFNLTLTFAYLGETL